jgi:succinate dehydrogenase / fumarate reductase flavoprotein subunit
MVSYVKNTDGSAASTPDFVFEQAATKWRERFEKIRNMHGRYNPYQMHQQLGEMMTRDVSVRRENAKLKEVLGKLDEMSSQWKEINVLDSTRSANQTLSFINQLWNMLELAKVITKGALLRDECRGAHYKKEFEVLPKTKDPTEDPEYMDWWTKRNEKWTKTTIATWTAGGPELSYEDVPRSDKQHGGLAIEKPRHYK